jgi:hypothetical protein
VLPLLPTFALAHLSALPTVTEELKAQIQSPLPRLLLAFLFIITFGLVLFYRKRP